MHAKIIAPVTLSQTISARGYVIMEGQTLGLFEAQGWLRRDNAADAWRAGQVGFVQSESKGSGVGSLAVTILFVPLRAYRV
jgi:hypothetical protein